MVYYGADDAQLRDAVDRFRASIDPGERARLFVRFDPGERASERIARLLDQFTARFGAPPSRNRATGSG
jgi:hypothetical protein